ncbi:P-loop containing nucleoside triphosphate hydrolase protein [Peniophora sp. CONT]|nr:P-loop containing nucleoside triphosphate hydrolase protein [Peniophora sp. CONT]
MSLKPDPLEIKKWWYPMNVSKRDYQFNISRHCLFENTLVALPTGLGKTFIAGVVMLNYYKWFPEGKVIFVAPTKPLVSQQIDACHKMCGIPGRDAIELTGEVKTVNRGEAWQKKRVFYMTPQTLQNDLKNGNCDPSDIVLLVIDEAHRATGEYAYATVVRHLMAMNPYFRVLALSATPGGTIEAVQNVIDSLHISHIECRHEENLDIARYMKTKEVKLHLIEMNEDLAKIRDLLGRAMKPLIDDVQGVGLCLGRPEPTAFSAFRAQMALGEINSRPDKARLTSKYTVLSKLGTLARAMGYLLEGTVGMCYESLKENMAKTNKDGKPSALTKDQHVRAVMQELERQAVQGFAIHPKMVELKNILIQYFASNIHDPDAPEGAPNAPERTCAMVFTNNRAAVEEIVDFLKQEEGMLRPTHFIGQGTDKKGKKGMAQREQLDIIKRFKAGEFNVMVSTSIGEEGLDIGEVDLVICYESPKTPVRMLQRVGRTGRKRQGYVHVLLSVGREEKNWDQAKEKYTELQQIIMRGQELEFYADVERLIPENVKPECCEQVMLIEEYDREASTRQRLKPPAAPKGTKRKRGDDVPAGAVNGFVSARALKAKGTSVADMLKQQKPKRRKKDLKFDDGPLEDDDTDAEIEAGPLSAAVRRVQSAPAKSTAKKTKAKAPRKRKKVTDASQLTASQLARQGADDSDDEEIERGLLSRPRRSATRSISSDDGLSPPDSPDIPLQSTLRAVSDDAVLDLCTSDEEEERARTPLFLPSSDPASATRRLDSSPTLQRSRSLQPSSPVRVRSPVRDSQNLAWLLEGSDDEINISDDERPNGASRTAPAPSRSLVASGQAIEISDSEVEVTTDVARRPTAPTSSPIVVLSPAQAIAGSSRPRNGLTNMPPPTALPSRFGGFTRPSLTDSPSTPEPSLPIGKKRSRPIQHDLSSPSADTSPALKRLQRGPRPAAADPLSSSPIAQRPLKKLKKIRVHDTAAVGRRNQFLDVEAGHSGDEQSAGSDDGGDPELSSEGDNSFLAEPGATQMSPSYDQSAIYRTSLLSQAPPGWGPQFGNGPKRRGAVPYAARERAQRGALSSDGERDSEPDDYEMGSFVVDDEADLF